jgi:hypothetical protein
MKTAKAKSKWSNIAEHPGFVFMRTVARLDSVRGAAVALQRAGRPSLGRFLRSLDGRTSRFFPGVDAARFAAGVVRDGYSLGLDLPVVTVAALNDFAQGHACYVDRNPALGFMPAQVEEARRKLGRPFLLAQYFNLLEQSPLISELSADPVLLAIAAHYLRTAPTLVGANLFWSYPAAVSADQHNYAAQMFHYDLDDFKFLKFFFYLIDVDSGSGPHVIVKATHNSKRFVTFGDRLKVRRYTDEEIVSAYGQENIVTITGPSGTGFAEDTLCIHKGQPPTEKVRLILQFQYALNDWGVQHDRKDQVELSML